MRRSAAILVSLGLAFDVPAVHAGGGYGYGGGYSGYNYGYSGYSYYPNYQPAYYYPANNYYNTYNYPVQPVVVQSNLVPSYVFQSAAALTPPVSTSTTVTTTRQTATTTTTAAQTQAAVATQSAGAVVAGGSGAALAVGGGGAVQAQRAVVAASSASPCAATESRLQALEAKLAGLTHPVEDEPPTLAAESTTDHPKVYEQPSSNSDDPQAQAIVTALQNSCLPCHSAASHKGNVTLFDAAGQFAPSVDARTIFDAVSAAPGESPRMPKGKPPLDPVVVQALERLIAGEGR